MKTKYKLHITSLIFLLCLCSSLTSVHAQTTIINTSATWKYSDDGSNQGTNWRTTTFNDSAWQSGGAELGYGDNPVTALAPYRIGYFFRKAVSITNVTSYSNFTMKIRRDDGIVVYINNVEVYRNNMPAGTINYNTPASTACSDDGNAIFTITLSNSVFGNGNNTIAAEVHNCSASSSDITFELSLIANPVATCITPNVNLFGNRNVTSTTAEVFWSPVTGVQSYNVEYRIRNAGAAYSPPINTNTPSLVLTNLQAATNYEFIVQSSCTGNSVSSFSSSGYFTTLPVPISSCSMPNYLLFGNRNKTSISAEVFWRLVPGVQSYNLEYRIRNSGAAYSTPVNTTSAFLVLTNLQPLTNYEFIVQSVCPGNVLSAYTRSGWFTTLPATGGTATLLRGPYMPVATSNSITIQWRTSIATNNKVKYGTDSTLLINLAVDSTLSTEHSMTLNGLQPATKYFYSIGTIDSVLQGDVNNYFYTAPANGDTQAVKFWVTGDFGNGGTRQIAVRNSFTNYTSGQVVNGWIWLGDNVQNNGTDAEYQAQVFDVYNSILKNIPIFPTLGNHDYAQSGYQSAASLSVNFPYFNIFTLPASAGTEKYYSTNYANIHIISLDSYGSYNYPSGAMYNWLSNDLANNTQQWTIVYFHHPPYTKGSHNSDTEIELINMRNNIIPLLESYGVDLVLSGDSHVYERSNFIKNHTGLESTFDTSIYPLGNIIQAGGGPYTKSTRTGNGTVYVVCGASGQPVGSTMPGYPHNAMYHSNITNNGSLILDVAGGNLTCKFLTSTGLIDDEFTIQKQDSAPIINARSSNGTIASETLPFIYPNPSEGDINIRIDNQEKTQITVSIYSLSGSIVFRKSYLKAKNENILIENSETRLSPGIYILNVRGENINSSNKLVMY